MQLTTIIFFSYEDPAQNRKICRTHECEKRGMYINTFECSDFFNPPFFVSNLCRSRTRKRIFGCSVIRSKRYTYALSPSKRMLGTSVFTSVQSRRKNICTNASVLVASAVRNLQFGFSATIAGCQ